jgi:hypothetical protein
MIKITSSSLRSVAMPDPSWNWSLAWYINSIYSSYHLNSGFSRT